MIRQAHDSTSSSTANRSPTAHQQTSKFGYPNLPGFKNGLIPDFI
jgi:hypothetical protein